ncbi:WD repeat-containing protein 60 [Oopsacas minuta]|uniref:WD repeat-containing protein 60 n=1 Tax=Oopsacas minuta TaxID=111878 RepID=A0AAV7KC32_9METZ|nr:WD repeat-containing protein 60 [Oopsacas minuta]
MHGCRHTSKPPIPKSHCIKDQNTSLTYLDFHPLAPDYFIVSYADGFFAVFNREYKFPILTCSSSEIVSLKRVMWSRVHPLVVYTLSEKGKLSVWDLSINKLACISKENMCDNIDIIYFDLIPERSTSFPHSEIELSLSDSSCQIHPLKHISSSSKGDSFNTGDELEEDNKDERDNENIPITNSLRQPTTNPEEFSQKLRLSDTGRYMDLQDVILLDSHSESNFESSASEQQLEETVVNGRENILVELADESEAFIESAKLGLIEDRFPKGWCEAALKLTNGSVSLSDDLLEKADTLLIGSESYSNSDPQQVAL